MWKSQIWHFVVCRECPWSSTQICSSYTFWICLKEKVVNFGQPAYTIKLIMRPSWCPLAYTKLQKIKHACSHLLQIKLILMHILAPRIMQCVLLQNLLDYACSQAVCFFRSQLEKHDQRHFSLDLRTASSRKIESHDGWPECTDLFPFPPCLHPHFLLPGLLSMSKHASAWQQLNLCMQDYGVQAKACVLVGDFLLL